MQVSVVYTEDFVLLQTLAASNSVVYGLLFNEYLTTEKTSATVSSWIYNFGILLSSVLMYFMAPVMNECSWRSVIFVLGLMNGLGYILSSFIPSVSYLFLFYSILVGEYPVYFHISLT